MQRALGKFEEAHRGFLNGLKDQAFDFCFGSPVIVIAGEDNPFILTPFDKAEGTGANRVFEVVAAVFFDGGGGNGRAKIHCQVGEEGSIGFFEADDKSRVVGGFELGDDFVHAHVFPVFVGPFDLVKRMVSIKLST